MAKGIFNINSDGNAAAGMNPVDGALAHINKFYKEEFIWVHYEPRYFNPADETNRLLISGSAFQVFAGRSQRNSKSLFPNIAGDIGPESDLIYIYTDLRFLNGVKADQNDYILDVSGYGTNRYKVRHVYYVRDVDIYTWNINEEYLRAICKYAGTDIDIDTDSVINFDNAGNMIIS